MTTYINAVSARIDDLRAFEHALVRELADAVTSRPMIALLRASSRLGDWGLSALAGILLLVFVGPSALFYFALTTGCGLLIQRILKRRWLRLRPCQRLNGPPQRVAIPDEGSFPSGHTLHAVLAAVVIVGQAPLLALFFVPVAVLIAASRIVLGVHYPSDVAAGAAIGLIFGSLIDLMI